MSHPKNSRPPALEIVQHGRKSGVLSRISLFRSELRSAQANRFVPGDQPGRRFPCGAGRGQPGKGEVGSTVGLLLAKLDLPMNLRKDSRF